MSTSNASSTISRSALSGSSPNRLYFLDHLRAVVILLVIVLHASITYMAFPPEWWYVLEPENSLFFTAVVLLLDVPLMLILFFVAGFFAYPSIERHGVKSFLRQKAKRLGLPWVVGVVFLAPPVAYLITVTRNFAKPYLEFWLTDFWGPFYQQSVYWFLGILLLLFALFALAYNAEPRLQHVPRQAEMPTWRPFAVVAGLTTLWFFLVSTAVPVDTWSSALKLFTFQPARLLLYASYFCLGIYADRKGWFREDGYQPPTDKWLLLTFVTGGLYLAFRFSGNDEVTLVTLLLQAVLFNAFCFAGVIGSVTLFYHAYNQAGRLWASLDRNAFAIYYLHPIILYPAAYVALSLAMPIFLEVALLVVGTAVVSWGLSTAVLTRWPILRDIF